MDGLTASGEVDRPHLDGKIAVARFFADNLLPQAAGLAAQVTQGGETTLAFTAERFVADLH